MRILKAAALALAVSVVPAMADEVEDVLTGAIAAYQDGDIKLAREEIEYALTLLKKAEAVGLVGFLPLALDGWTRTIEEGENAMAMFGGGISATGNYATDGEEFTLTLLANSPLVTSMAAMFSSVTTMSAMGEIRRIGREKFLITDGQVQGLINKTVMVQVEGDDVDAIFAHLKTMDIAGLRDF